MSMQQPITKSTAQQKETTESLQKTTAIYFITDTMDNNEMDNEFIDEDQEDEEESYQKDDDEFLDMGILAGQGSPSLPTAAPPLVEKISWKPEETNALITKYKKLISHVKGFSENSAKFVSKIQMFGHIADEISREFNTTITASQCQNRYKTMIRGHRRGFMKNVPKSDFEIVYTDPPLNKSVRKKATQPPTTRSTAKSDDDNNTSDFNLVQNALKVENDYDIEYSDSNNLLTNDDEDNNDDDDEHIDHRSAKKRRFQNVDLLESQPDNGNNPTESSQSKQQKTISGALLLRETMLDIYKMQEQNKDRRHQEWMDMWKSYLNTQKQ